jgi:hypothetical protein
MMDMMDMTTLILPASLTGTFGEGPVATIPHQAHLLAKSMALVLQPNITQPHFLL